MVPFEREFAAMIGATHCVSCANGTDALYIALRALGASIGDEVITTAHTWISTSEVISQVGAEVVFCDTDEKTFNIDPDLIEAKITPRTKGIIVVHLCGQPANVDRIRQIADKHGMWLIEDCAQAHLASLGNKTVGTFGDIATFSFYPGKNLGAMGDAGCVVTDKAELAEWMTLFARHGGKGNHVIEGINSRLDGLQAAILRVKLPHLPRWTLERQQAASIYGELFEGVEEVDVPLVEPGRSHVYHLYMIRLANRDLVQKKLSEAGVQTSVNYSRALPFYDAYKHLGLAESDFPNAFLNQNRILSLPIYPGITLDQQQYVVSGVKTALNSI